MAAVTDPPAMAAIAEQHPVGSAIATIARPAEIQRAAGAAVADQPSVAAAAAAFLAAPAARSVAAGAAITNQPGGPALPAESAGSTRAVPAVTAGSAGAE